MYHPKVLPYEKAVILTMHCINSFLWNSSIYGNTNLEEIWIFHDIKQSI